MQYYFDTNDRPFNAIKAGTKTVEGRCPTLQDKTPYNKIKNNDTIVITNNKTLEKLTVKVKFIHHYSSAKEMLESEGVQNVLSSEPKTIEHGIESYNSIEGYAKGILENGIYAIGVKLQDL